MISPMPLALTIQVMDPIVNDWLGSRRTIELKKRTIWFAIESARTPLTWCATIDKIWSAVYRGYAYDSR
jgi:hypothetical protein